MAGSSKRRGAGTAAPAPEVAAPIAEVAKPASADTQTNISVSRGFGAWLGRMGCSLAFTSYQSGQLFLVGRLPDLDEGRDSRRRRLQADAVPQDRAAYDDEPG